MTVLRAGVMVVSLCALLAAAPAALAQTVLTDVLPTIKKERCA